MQYLKYFLFVILFMSLNPSLADDFQPFSNFGSGIPSTEIRSTSIELDLTNTQIYNQDSYYISNSCSTVSLNRNLLFLTKRVPFSYCYPTWLILNFITPADWVPGTDMYLDLNWFTLDNSMLGSVSYKETTTWNLFYKILDNDDKIITSFDKSNPSNVDQALNNLVTSFKDFHSSKFTFATPTEANKIVSSGNKLVIKSEHIIPNKKMVLVLHREVLSSENKFYQAINLDSAKIIYSKKHLI